MKLDVRGHYVENGSLLPGQVKVTQQQFEAIALAQLTELWSTFGSLTEIWFASPPTPCRDRSPRRAG